MTAMIDRRALLRGAALAGGTAAFASWLPAWAQTVSPGLSTLPTVSGEDITLRVAHQMMQIDGRQSHAIGINGTVPAPLIRLREGQKARLHVVNELDEETSVHWHGLILPFHMDGVPGVSFPGIPARSRFTYEFPIVQSGTYWYHSHSGLQEQMGHYGPIVIDPAGADPVGFDREHVIVLSDHSPLHPHAIFQKLKKQAGYFNRQRQTLAGLLERLGPAFLRCHRRAAVQLAMVEQVISLDKGDLVIFSSRTIPGNEKAVGRSVGLVTGLTLVAMLMFQRFL